jgi:3-hydroxyisobutyrate dehydrogenase
MSASRCWSVDTYNPVPGVMEGVPSSRQYAGGFGTALMEKDVGDVVCYKVDIMYRTISCK